MAATRTANAHWEGTLKEGKGTVALSSSGIGTYDVSWPARTEEPNGVTSPEELIAAAHSTCYSMSLSNELTKAGSPPETVDTRADVTFQPGEGITGVHLTTTCLRARAQRRTVRRVRRDREEGLPGQRRPGRHHDHPGRHAHLRKSTAPGQER